MSRAALEHWALVDAAIVGRGIDTQAQGIEIVEVGQHRFDIDQLALHVFE